MLIIKKTNHLVTVCCFLGVFSLFACQQDQNVSSKPTTAIKEKAVVPKADLFNAYWYSGKAEINSYALKQSRYGDIREGEVVLVFVTEPFSLSKQVKLDRPKAAAEDNVSVMKLNNIRKFTTGIYDYSIVTSTFSPVDFKTYPHTLKLNTSIQEWCGHTFTQLNLEDQNYQFQQFSYFEADGDTEKNIPVSLLEDELFTRIRLNKGQLPLGEIDMIFSTLYSRFNYKALEATKATISKTESDSIINYTIDYLSYDRNISIAVQNEFPYKILSWTEDNGDGLITEARLKKSINEPYWNQKSVSDEAKRRELQLLN
ncbi:septum formation inhibitor Maf [Formosa sp. PL04]|uniref:septum formation inhibitor Maf n=1 Tax=Formosa sp. PL04 TaxID=3081755 RepID=UPI0029819B1C|nr:septum formation inhibitor Maf [Formosa sp. PL04]MDW5290559.1 septum formation inhibitor Maf [Formosa sp. PL04]